MLKIIIVTVILLSIGISYYTSSRKKNITRDFDPAFSFQLVKEGALLIDVRTKSEFEQGHVDGAHHIPYDELESYLQKIEKLTKGDKGAPIVLYCQSGNRSGIGKKTLLKHGYTKVINHGGLSTWQGLGQPKP